MLATAATACLQSQKTITNLTAKELCLLANQVLNDAENHMEIGENERWNLSYQVVSARKPTEEDLADRVNLTANDWLLDVRVTMIHEYFRNGLWVTPPTNPVSYRLARYTYICATNTFQALEPATKQ